MTRKLLIVPWFGDLPPWFKQWRANVARNLEPQGYDVLLDQNLTAFKRRVKFRLGIEDAPIVAGEGKVHDYRCALGALYSERLAEGYDFWGHTDLDMVYGRVEQWFSDEYLSGLDIASNHVDYVSGPWTLYRNRPEVNELFLEHDDWRAELENPNTTGWVEKGYTELVDAYHAAGEITRAYSMWQTTNLDSFKTCRLDGDGRLWEGRTEIPMLHFRRTKEYPDRCRR